MLINIFTTEIVQSDDELFEQFICTVDVANRDEANKIIGKLNIGIGRANGYEYYYNEVKVTNIDDLFEKINRPVIVHMLLVSHKKDYSYIETSQDYTLPSTKNGEFEDINYINHWGPGKLFKFYIDLEVFENMSEKELIQFGLDLIGERMPEGFEYREIPKI